MKTKTDPAPTFFFGRCFRPTWTERTRSAAFDLSLDGKPMPWSDKYAKRCLDQGCEVEKIEFITAPPPHYPGETVTRRSLVDTLRP